MRDRYHHERAKESKTYLERKLPLNFTQETEVKTSCLVLEHLIHNQFIRLDSITLSIFDFIGISKRKRRNHYLCMEYMREGKGERSKTCLLTICIQSMEVYES